MLHYVDRDNFAVETNRENVTRENKAYAAMINE